MIVIPKVANASGIQSLLGPSVWLHACYQIAGTSLGTLSLARQVLSSSRLSLTHTASPKGYPCLQIAHYHLLYYFLFLLCMLLIAQHFSAQS